MQLKNCWEFYQCGLEPGGKNAEEVGICPATTETKLNGVNRGKNGGRACWAVSRTLCSNGGVYGQVHEKFRHCVTCAFFGKVQDEEGRNFASLRDLLKGLRLGDRAQD